jgi:hypothetical protein
MKLYAVEITYSAYVLAKDEFEAEDFVDDILSMESEQCLFVNEVVSNQNPLGWDPDCLVYHQGKEDITLAKARQLAAK